VHLRCAHRLGNAEPNNACYWRIIMSGTFPSSPDAPARPTGPQAAESAKAGGRGQYLSEFPPDPMRGVRLSTQHFMSRVNTGMSPAQPDLLILVRAAMSFETDLCLIAEGRLPDEDDLGPPYPGDPIGNPEPGEQIIEIVNQLVPWAKKYVDWPDPSPK
jgi:hypothetical protein